jgi:hypothetical protein
MMEITRLVKAYPKVTQVMLRQTMKHPATVVRENDNMGTVSWFYSQFLLDSEALMYSQLELVPRMQTLTGYEWRTYDEKLLDDVSNNDWATAFAKEIAGVNLPFLSQTYNKNYLQRLILTMGDFNDQVVGPSCCFPAGGGRTSFTKWDGEDFGTGEAAGHKKLLVTANGILADMASRKGEGMTQTSIVIKDLARKAAEQTKLDMKLIYSSSLVIEELKATKDRLNISDEEIDKLRKKAITIPSELAMSSNSQ